MGPAVKTRTLRRGGRAGTAGVTTALAVLALTGCTTTTTAHTRPPLRPLPAATATPDAEVGSPRSELSALRPVTAKGGHRPNGPVLVRVGEARGSKSLPTFVPSGQTLYLTFACLGSGHFVLGTMLDFEPCAGHSATLAVPGQRGVREHLFISAAPAVRWRLLITSGV